MSRARKPLEAQRGDLTEKRKVEIAQTEAAVKADKDQLEAPPEWLVDTIAVGEWWRVVNELIKVGIIGNLDVQNIAGYCNAFALYRRAIEVMKAEELYFDKGMIAAVKNYSDEMRKFAALCGLTIDSRLKVGSQVVSKKQEEVNDKFGDI